MQDEDSNPHDGSDASPSAGRDNLTLRELREIEAQAKELGADADAALEAVIGSGAMSAMRSAMSGVVAASDMADSLAEAVRQPARLIQQALDSANAAARWTSTMGNMLASLQGSNLGISASDSWRLNLASSYEPPANLSVAITPRPAPATDANLDRVNETLEQSADLTARQAALLQEMAKIQREQQEEVVSLRRDLAGYDAASNKSTSGLNKLTRWLVWLTIGLAVIGGLTLLASIGAVVVAVIALSGR